MTRKIGTTETQTQLLQQCCIMQLMQLSCNYWMKAPPRAPPGCGIIGTTSGNDRQDRAGSQAGCDRNKTRKAEKRNGREGK